MNDRGDRTDELADLWTFTSKSKMTSANPLSFLPALSEVRPIHTSRPASRPAGRPTNHPSN